METIERAIRLKKDGKVKKLIVMGCLVQRYHKELMGIFSNVDEWRGVEKFNQWSIRRYFLYPPHITFIKVCDGCINNCSYCAIPIIKGPLVSRRIGNIIEEAKFLDRRGVKELNIIGQDVTSWGKDLYKDKDTTYLLKNIVKNTKNIRWIRLLYTHPKNFTDSLIDMIAEEERLCKYVDLPIQHINDRILKMMNRMITKKEIIELIKKIRKKIKEVVIRTTIIVGFPTETEEEFKELLDFIEEIRFERLGVFMYSREEGSEAYKLKPIVPNKIKRDRYKEVMSLQQKISWEFNRSLIGRDLEVLIDSKENNTFIGRSQYSAYEIDGVVFIKDGNCSGGNFYKVNIVDASHYDLVGIIDGIN
ncbi:MAG: MiaB/RimO family radical SAM methylthiotransferase [Candidatus Omnitrophica bacterium]|nr:MiaB/RimO family radical SAM methylthiotransferase [Candidatus Omnitrophota bacterium]